VRLAAPPALLEWLGGLSGLIRTTSFRVAVVFAALFAGSALVFLIYLYSATAGRLTAEADAASDTELIELSALWQREGPEQLNRVIVERASLENQRLYVFLDPTGRALGNLSAVPIDLSGIERPPLGTPLNFERVIRVQFSYEKSNSQTGQFEARSARGRFIAFSDGYGLFVGRDLGDAAMVAERVSTNVLLFTPIILIMALGGGILVARSASRRADELSQTARAVMGGDFSRRARVRSDRDEFDALAADMNAMLDRIERLIKAARTTGDSVAHDLRSPLTRLRARLESAIGDAPETEVSRVALVQAVEELDEIVATFNAVLRLTRLEAGEGGRFETVDLSKLAKELGELFEPSFEDAGLAYALEVEPEILVQADLSLMAQALTNLLDNAIKYTPAGGGVTVRARKRRHDEVEVSVTDTGPGIPAEDRVRALERFVRLDSSRSASGSGIGLSLVSAIAELHRGRLELDDGAPGPDGPGLRVAIILPAAKLVSV